MKRPRRLTATFVERVRETGIFGDGYGSHGLSLRVHAMKHGGVSKSWRQRLRIAGRQVQLGLGPYPLVTLTEARDMALDNARKVRRGQDPRRATLSALTFAEAAEQVIALHRQGWKHAEVTAKQWRQSLRDYVLPKIGSKPVATITASDVSAVLTPIWHSKRSTAQAVKQRVSAVLKWSIGNSHRSDPDPTPEAVAALPRQNGRTKHHEALPHGEVAQALADFRGAPSTVLAFRFVTLTATRITETTEATWGEIDTEAKVWTIPADRMKAKREHVVPLSSAALDVLAEARKLTGGKGIVFPGRSGKAIGRQVIGNAMRRQGMAGTVHGMRTSFRSWANEQGVRREAAELAIAHTVRGVEGAYNRTDLLDERRGVMQDWADYLSR